MRILIIEDEIKLANSIKLGLEEESYAVDIENNGKKGFFSASINNYDLIILDLMLPEMNGFEILKKLREKSVNTPVIILTAKGAVEDKVEGLNLGSDDYLAKPFSFDELLARIKAVKRRGVEMVNEVKCGDININLTAKTVKHKGEPVNLSLKEYSILEYLCMNKGKVISEGELIEHIWDREYEGLSNIVAANIKNLRKKINDDDQSVIKNMRGRGYIIE